MTNPTDNSLAQIAANTAKANELLTEIHTAIELSGSAAGLGRFGLVSRAAPPSWRIDGRTELYDDGPGPPAFVTPLSYVLLQQQISGDPDSMSAAMKEIVGGMFNQCTVGLWDHHTWSREHQLVVAVTHEVPQKSHDFALTVRYNYKGIDEDESAITIGDEVRDNEQPYEQPGAGWLIDLTGEAEGDGDLAFEREEKVTLEKSNSMEVTHGMEIDVGVETEISGSIPGTGFEAKVAASFGYKNTEEEKKAEEESKTDEETTKIAKSCLDGHATRIGVESNDVNSHTAKSFVGPVIYEIQISANLSARDGKGPASWVRTQSFMGNHGRHGPRYSESGGVAHWTWLWPEFLAFLWARDTELPETVNRRFDEWPLNDCESPDAVGLTRSRDRLGDPQYRHINIDGFDVRKYKEGARVVVEDVTGQDLGAVAAAHGIPPNRIVTRGSDGLLRDRLGALVEAVA